MTFELLYLRVLLCTVFCKSVNTYCSSLNDSNLFLFLTCNGKLALQIYQLISVITQKKIMNAHSSI